MTYFYFSNYKYPTTTTNTSPTTSTTTNSTTSNTCGSTFNSTSPYSYSGSLTGLFSWYSGQVSGSTNTSYYSKDSCSSDYSRDYTYNKTCTSGTTTTTPTPLPAGIFTVYYDPNNADTDVVQYKDSNGQWQTLASGTDLGTLNTSDLRLYNKSKNTYVAGDSLGVRIGTDANGNTTLSFEDRYGTCYNDKDYNDVVVTITPSGGTNNENSST